MTRKHLLLTALLFACGGTQTAADAGVDASGGDATTDSGTALDASDAGNALDASDASDSACPPCDGGLVCCQLTGQCYNTKCLACCQ